MTSSLHNFPIPVGAVVLGYSCKHEKVCLGTVRHQVCYDPYSGQAEIGSSHTRVKNMSQVFIDEIDLAEMLATWDKLGILNDILIA